MGAGLAYERWNGAIDRADRRLPRARGWEIYVLILVAVLRMRQRPIEDFLGGRTGANAGANGGITRSANPRLPRFAPKDSVNGTPLSQE